MPHQRTHFRRRREDNALVAHCRIVLGCGSIAAGRAPKDPDIMSDAYIYDGLRTPFGRHAGALAPIRPDDLLAGVIKTLVARNPFKPEAYEDSVMGCTNQAGEDARNVARHAALLAGLPTSIGGITVNRLCGSGLAAICDAARAA